MIVLALAVLVGIGIAVLTDDSSSTEHTPSHSGSGTRVAAGTPGSSSGVWVFGSVTLRLDADLGDPRVEDFLGSGGVVGEPGFVNMFEAQQGVVERVDARHNRIEPLGTVGPGVLQDDVLAPVIAPTPDALWLVSRPDLLVRFDRARRAVTDRLAVVTVGAAVAVPTTAVVTTPAGVVAVSSATDGLTLRRVATGGHELTPPSVVAIPGVTGPYPIDGVTAGGGSIWLISRDHLLEVSPRTLQVVRVIDVGAAAGREVRGAAFASGALWSIADRGSQLVRVDAATGAVRRIERVLTHRPAQVPVPITLVAEGTRVYALVPVPRRPGDHSARLLAYDAARGTRIGGLNLASEVFAGAVALS